MQYVCDIPDCKPNGTTVANRCLIGDHSSPAQFYVCVGVLAFLYCTATLVLYLGYQHVYKNNARAPTVVRFPDCSLLFHCLHSCTRVQDAAAERWEGSSAAPFLRDRQVSCCQKRSWRHQRVISTRQGGFIFHALFTGCFIWRELSVGIRQARFRAAVAKVRLAELCGRSRFLGCGWQGSREPWPLLPASCSWFVVIYLSGPPAHRSLRLPLADVGLRVGQRFVRREDGHQPRHCLNLPRRLQGRQEQVHPGRRALHGPAQRVCGKTRAELCFPSRCSRIRLLCRSPADFRVPELDFMERKLLVHLQGNVFPQISQPACKRGGKCEALLSSHTSAESSVFYSRFSDLSQTLHSHGKNQCTCSA